MSDFFSPDDGDGTVISSDRGAEACYTVHGQVRVNRLFSVPRMSRTINPTAESMNSENPAARAQSEGNTSYPSTRETSSSSGSDISHIQLDFRPLTTECQVTDKYEKEVEEGEDLSPSTKQEPSEERNYGSEVATDTETRISPQASEQEAKEPAVLQEVPEKEEKEEEEAPAPHLADEKKEEEEEPVVPLPEPDKEQDATPLSLESKPSVPQLLPESEEKIPQLPPEKEPSLCWLTLEMELSVSQPSPKEEQEVPQLPQETEPSVPQPLPESEQNVPQSPVEMEPSEPHLVLKTEPPTPPPQVFKEPSLPQTPVEVEPSIPQPLKETPAPLQPPSQEPITPQLPAKKDLLEQQSLREKTAAIKERIALRRMSPYRFERPASQEENETILQPEPKALPGREDASTSISGFPKPTPAAAPQEGKAVSLSDTVEDLASHLREVGNASKSAMASSISSFVASPLGRVFALTIDRALEKSEEWLDYYLPVETDVEPSAEEGYSTASEDLGKEGCFMRLSSLSTKLRNRAFRLALHQLKSTQQSARETLPVLDQVLGMLDRTHDQNLLNIPSIPESLQNLWAQRDSKQEPPKSTKMLGTSVQESPSIKQLELKALDLTRTLALEMYSTYHNLLPHMSKLPAHLQEKVIRVYENMEELQAHFTSSSCLRDMPSNIVIQSQQRMTMARENLDEILDFLGQSRAANWLSHPAPSPKTMSGTAARPLNGRSPERKAREENSMSSQPPSLPHP